MREPTVPLRDLPSEAVERLAELGATPRTAAVNVYRALANNSELLLGWIDLAWALRQGASTPRRLRELVIIRGAMLSGCEYELRGHIHSGLRSGVTSADLDALPSWREHDGFSDGERAALALCDAMHEGAIPDAVLDDLARHFDPADRVELITVCAFYDMASRTIDALRLPLEERHRMVYVPEGYASTRA